MNSRPYPSDVSGASNVRYYTFLGELCAEIHYTLQQNEALSAIVAEKQRNVDDLTTTVLKLQAQVQQQQEVCPGFCMIACQPEQNWEIGCTAMEFSLS
jgi:hypothetical protein